MPWLILAIIILSVLYGPALWAGSVLAKNSKSEYFSGDGFEFARLLLKELGMDDVKVEESLAGDHYDPLTNTVRLTKLNCGKRSLTAVVVAAHEIGHAIQKREGYLPLVLRTRLAHVGFYAEKAGAFLILGVPIIISVLRVPAAGLLVAAGGFLALGFPIVVHLITLPVEFDASFRRALPILTEGKWIPSEDLKEARKILLACALTYVASALAGILNFWRWIRFIR